MMLSIRLVDAFADGPFTGNPAAVVLLRETIDDGLMGQIAMEMNQAETAFVAPRSDGICDLRWFTPTVEVDLCGHATLAAAHVLWEQGAEGAMRFETRSGTLSATRTTDGIALDFPAEPPVATALPHALPFLGETVWTRKNRMDWFVQVKDEGSLRSLQPDLAAISALGMRGLVLTAAGDEFDFAPDALPPIRGRRRPQ